MSGQAAKGVHTIYKSDPAYITPGSVGVPVRLPVLRSVDGNASRAARTLMSSISPGHSAISALCPPWQCGTGGRIVFCGGSAVPAPSNMGAVAQRLPYARTVSAE